MCTEMQTAKNHMTLQNRAQEVTECQSSGVTVSAWCELHGKNVKPISSMRSTPKPYRLKDCQKTSEA